MTGPELGDVETELFYQSPEIYSTDVAEFKSALAFTPAKGKPFNASMIDIQGMTPPGINPLLPFGDKDLGPLIMPPNMRPTITFKLPTTGLSRFMHFHMVDKNTGEVFWDGDYRVIVNPAQMAYQLNSLSVPGGGGTQPIFRKFWIPENDPGPHYFDIKIETRDNYYLDPPDNEWGDDEGFDNLYGHAAHIGVKVYRLPKIAKATEADVQVGKTGMDLTKMDIRHKDQEIEEVGPPSKSPGKHSIGPTHHDIKERIIRGEQDLFKDPITGDPNRSYYGWTFKRDGLEQGKMAPEGQSEAVWQMSEQIRPF